MKRLIVSVRNRLMEVIGNEPWVCLGVVLVLMFVGMVHIYQKQTIANLGPQGGKTLQNYLTVVQRANVGDFINITWNRRAVTDKWEWQNGNIVSTTETFAVIGRGDNYITLQGPGPDSNENQQKIRFHTAFASAVEWQGKIENLTTYRRGDVGFETFGGWYWLN